MHALTTEQPLALVEFSSDARLTKFDLLIVLFFVIVAVLVGRLPFHPRWFGDIYFHEEAKVLACVVRQQCVSSQIYISHAPGPVLYYAVPYSLMPKNASESSHWRLAVVFNLLFSCISALLLRRVGTLLFGGYAGVFAAVLFILVPLQAYYSLFVSAEAPAAFGFTVFLFGWARGNVNREKFWPLTINLWLLALGLLTFVLCRPNGLASAGVWGLTVALLGIRREPLARRESMRCVMGLAIFSIFVLAFTAPLVMLPQEHRAHVQKRQFIWVLFIGSFQYRTEPWDWSYWYSPLRASGSDYRMFSETNARLSKEAEQNGVSVSTLRAKWIVQDLLQHPGPRVQMFFVRLLALHVQLFHSVEPARFRFGPLHGERWYLVVHVVINGVGIFLLVGSVIFLIRYRGQLLCYSALWAPYLGLLIFHGISAAEPRYMFPCRSALCLMAGAVAAKRFAERPVQDLSEPCVDQSNDKRKTRCYDQMSFSRSACVIGALRRIVAGATAASLASPGELK